MWLPEPSLEGLAHSMVQKQVKLIARKSSVEQIEPAGADQHQ